MIPDVRTIYAAFVILILGVVASGAQGDPQTMTEAKGTWRIVALPSTDSSQQNFSLVTQAMDHGDADFALVCKKEPALYYFEIKTARLTNQPSGEDVSIAVRLPNQEAVRFLVATGDHGTVVVQERTHQTAFSLILATLLQSDVATFEFSAGDHQWRFSLDGFKSSAGVLAQRCGFPPDPTRLQSPG